VGVEATGWAVVGVEETRGTIEGVEAKGWTEWRRGNKVGRMGGGVSAVTAVPTWLR
jgi:hypothetical protein